MTSACSLPSPEAMRSRVAEWHHLLSFVVSRTEIDGGYRLALQDHAPIEDVVRLARAEQGCCSFFSFAVTFDDRGVGLEVRSPPSGRQILNALFSPPGEFHEIQQ
jgi:hypothetical protein